MKPNDKGDYDEAYALRLLSRGSEQGFRMIYDRYARGIYAASLKMLQSEMLAEDVVQDVFMRIWKNPERFTHVEDLRPYLFKVSKYACLRKFKQMSREMQANKEYVHRKNLATNDVDDYINEKDYSELVKQAVEKLPPQRKRVFKLVREQGLSHEATATQLQLSPATVNNHIGLAVKFINDQVMKQLISLTLLSCFLS
ncbi:RNA polymerase sigma-70 factor [Fulvivirgaceae bacterium PWU4]|uniref:RNA polymerase sigma factor n=1 Tax=Chryseosolibacter histidini TaxID=2782349 RepID=A0AAP2DS76_9BACT|nr:RNA polymerase sigma-70 factor [Chryseosolibacter histidini]MBT1701510.1 RNA polymerase sigma-70 factor [Chryseosolibacter histidini]